LKKLLMFILIDISYFFDIDHTNNTYRGPGGKWVSRYLVICIRK